MVILEYNIHFAARAFDNIPICTMDMLAIHKASNLIVEHNLRNSVIISDSLSAIEKITDRKTKNLNNMVIAIKSIKYELRKEGMGIHLL